MDKQELFGFIIATIIGLWFFIESIQDMKKSRFYADKRLDKILITLIIAVFVGVFYGFVAYLSKTVVLIMFLIGVFLKKVQDYANS